MLDWTPNSSTVASLGGMTPKGTQCFISVLHPLRQMALSPHELCLSEDFREACAAGHRVFSWVNAALIRLLFLIGCFSYREGHSMIKVLRFILKYRAHSMRALHFSNQGPRFFSLIVGPRLIEITNTLLLLSSEDPLEEGPQSILSPDPKFRKPGIRETFVIIVMSSQ